MPRLCSSLLLSLLIASSASAVTMDWVTVGDPGNSADTRVMHQDGTTGYGSVSYVYQIGKYDVTNAQYTAFLNAKAQSDPLGLYNTNMSDPSKPDSFTGRGGITRSGSSGSYIYTAIAGRENMPVNYVSFYDALRFANWMNNGQGNGNTETGAYTLLGGTATPSNGTTVTRNFGATIVLTSENEWYKAAYYDAVSRSYYAYPAGSNAAMTCTTPTATANSANCNFAVNDMTNVGSYTGSPSPYGTFDQGGNATQWNESNQNGSRGIRGPSFSDPVAIGAADRLLIDPAREGYDLGFRVAMLPEPGNEGLLVLAGFLGLAGWRRNSAQPPLRIRL